MEHRIELDDLGYPQMDGLWWFMRESPIKMDDLGGVPHDFGHPMETSNIYNICNIWSRWEVSTTCW